MGLLSLLFGEKPPSNLEVEPDFVWLTREAKFNGVRRDLLNKSNSRSAAILLIAHFDDVHSELERIVGEYSGEVPALVVSAADLSSRIAANFAADENTMIDLIVAERHPLVSEDDRVISGFADDLPCKCRVSYHLSLEDPLMRMFVGKSITELLRKLGMKEDEAIESSMVIRRINQAQKKLSSVAHGNRPAETAQQWMDLNIPKA